MEIYDVIMLLVLAGATVIGAWKGMAWQVASLASIFASYFVAYQFRGAVATFIDYEPPWNIFLAMLILYVACSLVIWVVFRMVAEFIDRLKLKEFDHQMGAVVGAAKGVTLCVIITLFAVTLLSGPKAQQVMDSRSGYYIALLLNRAHPVMPDEFHDALEPYIHSLDSRLDDKAIDHHAHERNSVELSIPGGSVPAGGRNCQTSGRGRPSSRSRWPSLCSRWLNRCSPGSSSMASRQQLSLGWLFSPPVAGGPQRSERTRFLRRFELPVQAAANTLGQAACVFVPFESSSAPMA